MLRDSVHAHMIVHLSCWLFSRPCAKWHQTHQVPSLLLQQFHSDKQFLDLGPPRRKLLLLSLVTYSSKAFDNIVMGKGRWSGLKNEGDLGLDKTALIGTDKICM